jgi:hypothetical protein
MHDMKKRPKFTLRILHLKYLNVEHVFRVPCLSKNVTHGKRDINM